MRPGEDFRRAAEALGGVSPQGMQRWGSSSAARARVLELALKQPVETRSKVDSSHRRAPGPEHGAALGTLDPAVPFPWGLPDAGGCGADGSGSPRRPGSFCCARSRQRNPVPRFRRWRFAACGVRRGMADASGLEVASKFRARTLSRFSRRDLEVLQSSSVKFHLLKSSHSLKLRHFLSMRRFRLFPRYRLDPGGHFEATLVVPRSLFSSKTLPAAAAGTARSLSKPSLTSLPAARRASHPAPRSIDVIPAPRPLRDVTAPGFRRGSEPAARGCSFFFFFQLGILAW